VTRKFPYTKEPYSIEGFGGTSQSHHRIQLQCFVRSALTSSIGLEKVRVFAQVAAVPSILMMELMIKVESYARTVGEIPNSLN
jgi:hypothetical protein